MIEKIMCFAAKLAIAMITVITVEGLFTMGDAFNFQNYNFVAWLFQICVLILCIRAAMLHYK